MVKLKKDTVIMEVETELQASAFVKNGYEVITENEKDTQVKKGTKSKK